MKITIILADDSSKSVYDYTLNQLLSMVEKQSGKDIVELILGAQYSFTFLNHQKAFTFSTS